MLEMLQDKPLELAGAAFALIAILVSVVIYYLQRQRKELAFGVLSEHHLLGVDEELADRVAVTFDGQLVKNIRLVIFGVKNSGNQPILINDFEGRSMRFTFGENAKVLSTEIIHQSPHNLGCSLEVVEDTIQVKPLLLNSNDYFVVQVLVTAPEINMQADIRLVGIPTIVELSAQKPENLIASIVGRILALSSLILIFPVAAFEIFNKNYLFLVILLIPLFAIPIFWHDLRGAINNLKRRYIDMS
ncbi:hypothetical protein [Thiothrix winogradskyi]|uniref:Uncharacterized protein n=1 Tax=Thiothrix winogradskyi TaxID=96472 RepID=A0ABY3T441_9GAMM|nr:hypothetical protein [Thiothrix winogradskyi]UJS26155.1 hypothetical protein L2Y54_08970 [Thiothrix winogradskyi]